MDGLANSEKFMNILRTIIQRSERDIRNCEDFISEDLNVATMGIRYVLEYAETHSEEINKLLTEQK